MDKSQMKTFYICIFLLISEALLAISAEEKAIVLQTRELKQQWESASTGTIGDDFQINLEKIEQLHKEYAASLIRLLARAIKAEDVEQDDSLWNFLVTDPDFHVDVISKTLNTTELSAEKKGNAIEKIIRAMESSELQKYNAITLNRLLLSSTNAVWEPAQKSRIVSRMLNCPQLPLLFFSAFPEEQRIDSYLWAQAADFDSQLAGGKFSVRAWLALCILARRQDAKALEKVCSIADRMPVINALSLNMIPLGLAFIGNQRTVNILAEMLKSDVKTINGEDAVPPQTQLCHMAASALGLIVKDFPQYHFYADFSAADKQRCIAWMKQNSNQIFIIKRDWKFFYSNTLLNIE
jgi:hypothetical protein